MIPMAISLGFGIVFATIITLLLIPALYLASHDIYAFFTREKRASTDNNTNQEEKERDKLEEFILGISQQKKE